MFRQSAAARLPKFHVPVVLSLVCLGTAFLASALPGTQHAAVYAAAKKDHAAAIALFHEKGCEHCHGVDGVGGEKGPSLVGVGRKLKSAEIEKQITQGGDGMPSFADVLAPDEVTELVGYLSSRKKKVKVKSTPSTGSVPAAKPNTGGSDDQ